MPDLIRTPKEIKTMLNSVFMAQLQYSNLSIETPKIKWFQLCLVEELEHEIFRLLCEEERNSIKQWLDTKKEFLYKQLILWYQSKKDKNYKMADLIRDWLMQTLNLNPEKNIDL